MNPLTSIYYWLGSSLCILAVIAGAWLSGSLTKEEIEIEYPRREGE